MSAPVNDFYDFGPFRLDVREKSVRRGNQEIPLTPKSQTIPKATWARADRKKVFGHPQFRHAPAPAMP